VTFSDLDPLGMPPELTADLPPMPGPTLADAASLGPVSGGPGPAAPLVEEAEPLTNTQIIGLVSELTAFGLAPELAESYKQEFQSNALVNAGVQLSGLSNALAAYGLTSGSGTLPPWLSMIIGVSALGYGVYSIRSKYGPLPFGPAATELDPGPFDRAGLGAAVPPSDISESAGASFGSTGGL
jgi:hypothetical protein